MDSTHPKTRPTQQVLGGSDNIQVGFQGLNFGLFSGSGWHWVI